MEIDEAIKRCKNGDKEAWNMIVQSYSRKVYNLALNFIADRDEAFDITQEVFEKLYFNLTKFKEEHNFTSWLLTLSRNHCIDYWRKNKKHRLHEEIDDRITNEQDSPEDIAVRESESENLRRKLLLIEPEMRIFLIMRDIQGLSYEDIAKTCNVPLGTVKSRINRARLKLASLTLGGKDEKT